MPPAYTPSGATDRPPHLVGSIPAENSRAPGHSAKSVRFDCTATKQDGTVVATGQARLRASRSAGRVSVPTQEE